MEPLVFSGAYLERNPTSDLPGTHFPRLAFKKLVRLGGVAPRKAFTVYEWRRLVGRFPTWTRRTWVRRIGWKIEITAKAWVALHALGVTPETLEAVDLGEE